MIPRTSRAHGQGAGSWRPELDVLRLLAFLAVFFHHALPGESAAVASHGFRAAVARALAAVSVAGSLGVDLFFCLSAYLITEILRREHAANGRLDVPAFWARRALRIWPLYFGFLAFAALVVPRFMPGNRLEGSYLVSFLVFLGNWACAARGFPQSVASPLWSVSIEEQFYLAWPLLLLATRFERRLWIALGGALLAVGWVARILLVGRGADQPAIWCNTLAHLDSIVLGALLALVLGGELPRLATWTRFALGLSAAAALVALLSVSELYGATALVTYPLAALLCLVLLVSVLGAELPDLPMVGALAFLGRVSYGLYVFHLFALQLWRQSTAHLLLQLPAALATTVALALLSWFALEVPFLRLKERFARA